VWSVDIIIYFMCWLCFIFQDCCCSLFPEF